MKKVMRSPILKGIAFVVCFDLCSGSRANSRRRSTVVL